eukprot:9914234-Lingulodinium_polyedra.AAC.1
MEMTVGEVGEDMWRISANYSHEEAILEHQSLKRSAFIYPLFKQACLPTSFSSYVPGSPEFKTSV